MPKPLCIDLFCGLGGWSAGFLAEGWECIGFDIERHVYGSTQYPAQLVIQDVLTIDGAQFKSADCLVASPPCQQYSYFSMPWSLAKAKAAAIRADTTGQKLADLNRLFDACFRIHAQANVAAGRYIPLVVENVRGAQPWVGRSRWNFGSFHLWGDVPALMPTRHALKGMEGGNKGVPHRTSGHWTNSAEHEGIKQGGTWWHDPTSVSRISSSKSPARKAASAMIAKIPLTLSRHIAATFKLR
jgi:hypothetical protein